MFKSKFKNILLSTALATTLTACGGGGGGGGGAVGVVSNFVDNQVSQLAGSENIVNNYAANISSLNNILSGGDLTSLSNVFTDPTETDRAKATELLGIINNAQTLWAQVTTLINSQDDATKYQIYNSDDYKEAKAAFNFLTKTVKPIIGKVALGQAITLEDYNKVADEDQAFAEVENEKNTTVATEVAELKEEVNTVKTTETIDPKIESTTSEGAEYTETSYTDSEESTETITGEATSTESTNDVSQSTDNGNGTITTTVTRYTTTVTTTPVTTKTIKTRTYTDKTYKDVTTTVTTTEQIKKTYVDGTSITVDGVATSESTTVKTLLDTSTRTEQITVSEETSSTSTENRDDGLIVSTSTTSTAYTDLDPNLGDRTPGYSTDKTTYETNEYLDRDSNGNLQGWANGGKKQVKASDAYSRGWTGKGVTVAVADTGYDTDHSEFTGQIVATKDYTGTGMNDQHGHGTHVLGSVVAKKDGSGTHGVAFDSKAVVIKITNSNYANTSLAADGFSWAADQGASVGNISANSNYDVYFRNSLEQLSDGSYKSTDDRYDYSAGQFYNLQTPTEWKAATDKDLIVVNSAGNQGLSVAANPGYFATAVDSNGDLVLGGKMLIVGAVDQNNNIASWSNKAGHICRVIVDNSCTDTYKVSDFYILAPGWTYSTKNDGTYGTMAGTSMAAPYVTGGVALIRQMWPYMEGDNVVTLLTSTANKDIPNYNVNIHGSGIMDLEKATRPVGATGIPTTGRTTSSVSTVSLSNSGGSGSSLSAFSNSSALSNIMIVDDFNRDFYVDLTKGITVKDNRKYSDVQVEQYNASYLPYVQNYGSFTQGGQFPVFKEGLEFGIYTGEGGNGDWSSNISQKFKLTDKLNLKTTAGIMNEQETWLGNYTDGALAVGKNNETTFGQLGVEYNLGSNILSVDVAQGYTDVNTTSNSLITSVDKLQTQSIKFGYENVVDSKTSWGITYSLPNRITKGSATMNVPYATTMNGEVLYDNIKTDLSNTSTEKDIGFYYTYNGTEETDWKTSFSIEYRQNVAGVSGDDKIAPTMSISKKFWGACIKIFGMANNQPGCVKMRLEKKLAKLLKKKNKEKEIQEVRLQLMENEKKIAKIRGDELPGNTTKETAIAWNQ
jgi:subtilisin family serine protease